MVLGLSCVLPVRYGPECRQEFRGRPARVFSCHDRTHDRYTGRTSACDLQGPGHSNATDRHHGDLDCLGHAVEAVAAWSEGY